MKRRDVCTITIETVVVDFSEFDTPIPAQKCRITYFYRINCICTLTLQFPKLSLLILLVRLNLEYAFFIYILNFYFVFFLFFFSDKINSLYGIANKIF